MAKIKLRAAGVYTIEPDVFHGYRVIVSIALPAFLILLTIRGGSVAPTRLLLILASARHFPGSGLLCSSNGAHNGGWIASTVTCRS